jgi:hypothetical protein
MSVSDWNRVARKFRPEWGNGLRTTISERSDIATVYSPYVIANTIINMPRITLGYEQLKKVKTEDQAAGALVCHLAITLSSEGHAGAISLDSLQLELLRAIRRCGIMF